MTEIEFKYDARVISLELFQRFCQKRKPLKEITASGYDYFYENPTSTESFYRHRVGLDMNQLTFKRKTVSTDNFIRVEHNLDIASATTKEQIESFCGEFGYNYNFSLFKTCHVYTYEWYNLVYYVCYDSEAKELGRFVEIEISEEYPWKSQSEAWNELLVLEKLCKSIGISPENRVVPSLFELYRKSNVAQ